MFEHDQYGVSSVPPSELTKFADTLFSYFYYHLNLRKSFVRTSNYFQDIIGIAIFCTERSTFEFNSVVIESTSYLLSSLAMCQKVCSSFSDTNYFKKLYYVTAFILDYILWRYKRAESVDLAMGPYLWKKMFRINFECLFELNGGWQAFADAGEATMDFFQSQLEGGNELFLPGSYMAIIFGHINLVAIPPITPEELSFSLENFSLEHIFSKESKDSDDDDSAASDGDGNVRIEEPSASTSKKSSAKRKLDPTTHDSDSELDTKQVGKDQKLVPVAGGKGKVQIVKSTESTPEKPRKSTDRSEQKRKHEGSTATDSDEELYSPSSSKAKMGRK